MKTRFALFFLPLSLFSMYNNNPAAPELPEYGLFIENGAIWGAKVGYVGSAVFERRMKLDVRECDTPEASDGKPPPDRRSRNLKHLGYHYQQGALTASVSNRVEGYISLGSMEIKAKDRPMKGVSIEYTSDQSVVFGAGGRVILIYWGDALLGVSASYIRAVPGIEHMRQNGRSRPASGASMHYDEWQVGVAASRQFGWAVPYIGLGFGKAIAKIRGVKKDSSFSFRPKDQTFQNRTPATVLLGLSLTPNKIIVANFEGELIGEYGASGSIDLRF